MQSKMKFTLCLVLTGWFFAHNICAETRSGKPVKVFILAGQSNMEGHGHVKWGANPKRSKEWCKENPAERHIAGGRGSLRYKVNTNPGKYGYLVDEDGDWIVRDDVWIYWPRGNRADKKGRLTVGFGATGDGETIGPEFGFGHIVGEAIEAPVLLIKTAWGGKSLVKDFRPPSAVAKRGGSVGPYYTRMIKHVKETLANLTGHMPAYQGQGYEIAGFGWHQGWNDRINAKAVREYEKNLADLIRDVRSEWGKKLPFVVANTGIGGKNIKGNALALVKAQMAVADPEKHPEFKSSVAAVDTRDFYRPHIPAFRQGYHWHWNGETHYLIGEAMGKAMVKLLKSQPARNQK